LAVCLFVLNPPKLFVLSHTMASPASSPTQPPTSSDSKISLPPDDRGSFSGPRPASSSGFYGVAVSAPDPEYKSRKTIGGAYNSQTNEVVAKPSSTTQSLAEKIRDGFSDFMTKASSLLVGSNPGSANTDLPADASMSDRVYAMWWQYEKQKKPRPDGGCIKVQLFHAMDVLNTQGCRCVPPTYYASIVLGNQTALTRFSEAYERNPDNPRWVAINTYYMQTLRHEDLKSGADNATIDLTLYRYNWVLRDDVVGRVSVKVDEIYKDSFGVDRPRFYTIYALTKKPTDPLVEAGELFMRLKYVFPLVIIVQRAELRDDVQLIGAQDPYVYLRYHGLLAQGEEAEKYTNEHNNGGKAPRWNQAVTFNIADDGYQNPCNPNGPFVVMEVWDRNVLKDTIIAYTTVTFEKLMEAKLSCKSNCVDLYQGYFKDRSKDVSGKLWFEVTDRTERV